ncbi:MAG TPA: glycosyltransferase 87 family protein [Streptosporangiaceae bacterium]
MERTDVGDEHPAPVHRHWLSRGRLLLANGAFTVYAIVLAVTTGHADRTWAIWAAFGYGMTTVIFWLTRRTNLPVVVPLLVAGAGAVAAPVIWLATWAHPTAEVQVLSRSALLLLQHGTPYLAQAQFTSYLSYNPYLPVMAVFGLPKALGATGLLADPRIWLTVVSVALIWAAFTVAAPHRHCESCRRDILLSTVFITASPMIALPLAVGITDPPVIGLMFLALALITRPSGVVRAAVALGVACAMKATAWPAVPVLGVMLAARDTARSAWRFIGVTIVTAGVLSAALAPAALANPTSFVQNTVLFPLGQSKYKTPAASPLPGHLLAVTGTTGYWIAVSLVVAAGLAFVLSLIVRPPGDVRAAIWRLAVGLAVIFTLAPATRWGYFVYPIGLVVWLVLTRPPAPGPATAVEIPPQAAEEQSLTATVH